MMAGWDLIVARSKEASAAHRKESSRCLELAAQGLTSAQIAAQLSVVLRTVETHLSSIFRKLHLKKRSDLFRFATRPILAK